MKIPIGGLVTLAALVLAGSYVWTNREHIEKALWAPEAASSSAPDKPSAASDEPAGIIKESVTLVGPLAKFVAHLNPANDEAQDGVPNTADRVLGRSPVGTSRPLVNQTFAVARIVDIPFDLPAQAATPQLHGTFRALLQPQRKPSTVTDANLEFLVLNQKEYEDFLNERPADSLFAAEDAHDREVNVALPPTFGLHAAYHLVFRNNSPNVKKVVQANFRLDF